MHKYFQRHIALFLLLLVSIPIVYQPFHILEHRHGKIQTEHAYTFVHVNSDEETCYVCDFEFALFNTISVNLLAGYFFDYCKFSLSLYQSKAISFCFQHPVLRAPPAIS